jgi:hypothetical protein
MSGTEKMSDERRTSRGVTQPALERRIGVRGYGLYPAAASACRYLLPSGRSSTASGSGRAGQGHSVVTKEVYLKVTRDGDKVDSTACALRAA